MTNEKTNRLFQGAGLIFAVATLTACGGGGGGGDSGPPPPPPPPPSSVSYTLELSAVTLTDRQTGVVVPESGLPIAGATATRNQ